MGEPIGDLVRELCERLGVQPRDVNMITLRPGEIRVRTFLRKISLVKGRPLGARYVNPKTNDIAFEIRTHSAIDSVEAP